MICTKLQLICLKTITKPTKQTNYRGLKMAKWNPDHVFLDFLIELAIMDGADPDEPTFDEVPDGKEYSLREGVEKMRAGREKYWKKTYTKMYQEVVNNEQFYMLFEFYKYKTNYRR